MNEPSSPHPASFRDPAGFLFVEGGRLLRQVNHACREDYDALMQSGLYEDLVRAGCLISHEELDHPGLDPSSCYRVIAPKRIPFVSYPYEWCFSQLQDAALLTLAIQEAALQHGMILKDASAYNIQFMDGRPVFVDTLSFARFTPGEPWQAYRQFCQHFYAPLLLMAYRDIRLGQLLRVHLDGVPLDLASRILPLRSRFRFGPLVHLHLHAGSQQRHAKTRTRVSSPRIGQNALLGLTESLARAVKKLSWAPEGTEWAEYYQDTNYTAGGLNHKETLVREFLVQVNPSSVWDCGANVGFFSRISRTMGIPTVSMDIDPACVEKNYRQVRDRDEKDLLPLLVDLTNPPPGAGWMNTERDSLIGRGPVDAALALALVHHLAISNNLPFSRIADFFASICRSLIIEFVPKDDSQVQTLLSTREDIFPCYCREEFERIFCQLFNIVRSEPILDSGRMLYLMQRRD